MKFWVNLLISIFEVFQIFEISEGFKISKNERGYRENITKRGMFFLVNRTL